MKRQDLGYRLGDEPARIADRVPLIPEQRLIAPHTARGLSSHVRQLSKRNQGISRWIALAVVAGGVVALAFVQLAIR